MSQDTRATPGESPARQLAFIIGSIADTTEWTNQDYQALTARLVALGKPVRAITLGEFADAIVATTAAHIGPQRTGG